MEKIHENARISKTHERTRSGTRKYTKFILFSCLFVFLSVFFCVEVASAATLYFFPSSGSYNVGQNFSASIYVSSADQAMNAASGVISFPQDKLDVTSLSKSNSIFTLWVQEPSFSNNEGRINFEGIVLNPGFTGATGKIITVNFKAKAAGNALLNFSSGSVLANDGKGTNILASLGNAQFSLGYAAPTVPEATTPSAPTISSPTHPDPTRWYNNSSPKFIWGVSKDITASRILYDKNPDSRPTILYDPPISEKEISGIKDGVYYFHVQLRNKNGWGGTSHFRFQIDTTPPEPFSIAFLDGKETANPQPRVKFSTEDKISGVAGYQMKIGDGDWFDPQILKTGSYVLPPQAPEERQLLVRAFDKAGNEREAGDKFVILPAEKILPPIVITFPLILFGILLLVALILIGYLVYHLRKLKRKISLEIREAESVLHKAFDILKEDIQEQIEMLEKTRTRRQLTEEEEKIIKQLKKDLDNAERLVRREIEDIEKEIK